MSKRDCISLLRESLKYKTCTYSSFGLLEHCWLSRHSPASTQSCSEENVFEVLQQKRPCVEVAERLAQSFS